MEKTVEKLVQQYLTFVFDGEIYGINVSYVKEVLEYGKITRVPRTPDFLKGVINIRGSVVPVLDLRAKFDLEVVDVTTDSSIIVLELEDQDDIYSLSILVDEVNEVIDLSNEQIEPAPSIGTKIRGDFIKGIGKIDDNHFIIILNITKILSLEELAFKQSYNPDFHPESKILEVEVK